MSFLGYSGEMIVQQPCCQNGGVHLTCFSGEHLLCLVFNWIQLRMAIFVRLSLKPYFCLLLQDNVVVMLESWRWILLLDLGDFLFSYPTQKLNHSDLTGNLVLL